MKKIKFKYDSSWAALDKFLSILKMSMMLLRGIPYYFLFKKVGGLIFIGRSVKIRNPYYISTLGKLIVEDNTEIQGLSKKGLVFGENVTIGSYSMIRPSGYYGREIGEGLAIGNNSNIGAYCFLGCAGFVSIGDDVLMGPRVSILPENHIFADTRIPMKIQGVDRGTIMIGNDCWIGANVCILNNVTIQHGSILATGAVVTKTFPPHSVVGGVPAQLIKIRN